MEKLRTLVVINKMQIKIKVEVSHHSTAIIRKITIWLQGWLRAHIAFKGELS